LWFGCNLVDFNGKPDFCILLLPSLFPFVFPLDLTIPLHVHACQILATPKNSLLAILNFLLPVGFCSKPVPKLRFLAQIFVSCCSFGCAERAWIRTKVCFFFSFGRSPVLLLPPQASCPWRSVSNLNLLGLRSTLIFHSEVSSTQSQVYAPTSSVCVCWFSFAADILSPPEIFYNPRALGSSPTLARALGGL
jgi:hypothetical protein